MRIKTYNLKFCVLAVAMAHRKGNDEPDSILNQTLSRQMSEIKTEIQVLRAESRERDVMMEQLAESTHSLKSLLEENLETKLWRSPG